MPDLATTVKDTPAPPPKINKRKSGTKLDLGQVIKLRDVKGLSFGEISDITGYARQYIHRAYKEFKSLIQDSDITTAFSDNRVNILSSIEMTMLRNLSDKGKLKKASLNNVAYAFNQIHTARRLEDGKSTAGGTTINIQIAYQEATDRSKALRAKHVGSGIASSEGEQD